MERFPFRRSWSTRVPSRPSIVLRAALVVTTIVAAAAGLVVASLASNPGPAAAAAQAVSVTAYNPAGATLTQTIHDPIGVDRLVRDLDHRTPLMLTERFSCAVDNGSHYRAVVVYANGERVTAEVRRTGCERVTVTPDWPGGHVYNDPQLLTDLDALFPPDWQMGF